MKTTYIRHNDSIKYLVLAMIVASCLFVEVMVASFIINKYDHIPIDFIWVTVVVLVIAILAVAITPRDWKSNVAFKITDQGIIDQSTYLALGYIPWQDIRKVERVKRMNVDQIRIYLKEEGNYRAKKRPFARFLISIKCLFFGTPVVLSASLYADDLEDAYADIEAKVQSQHTNLSVVN